MYSRGAANPGAASDGSYSGGELAVPVVGPCVRVFLLNFRSLFLWNCVQMCTPRAGGRELSCGGGSARAIVTKEAPFL